MGQKKQKYKTGDIVRLKSGGPSMTVQGYSDLGIEDKLECQWFAGDKLQFGRFHPDSVELEEETVTVAN